MRVCLVIAIGLVALAGAPAQVRGPGGGGEAGYQLEQVQPSALQAPAVDAAPLPAGSLEPAVPELVVTLLGALRVGLLQSRDVAIQRRNIHIARAGETQAYAVYQPQLDLLAAYSVFDSARSGFQTGAVGANSNRSVSLRVEQLVFDTLQGVYDIYQSRQNVKAAEWRLLTTELTVAATVARNFFDALQADSLERLNEQLVAQALRNLQLAEARFEAGTGAKLDITRATVAVSNAKVALTAATSARLDALARLRRDLRLPVEAPLRVSDQVPVPPVAEDLAAALAAAVTERPEIHAADADRKARHHALTAARISRWVTLRVTGSFEYYLDNSRDVTSEYVFGGSLSLPLWDGQAGEAAETAAWHAYRRADEQHRQAVEEAALAVEQSYLAWRDATARLADADEAAALAQVSLQQTEESYALGVSSLLDVNDARTEYARAETNRITARFDRDLAGINVRLAMGRLPLPLDGAPSEATDE